MSFLLVGKVVLVMGNSMGLGKEIGLVLGKVGVKVFVNYFNNEVCVE